eukprot:458032_1
MSANKQNFLTLKVLAGAALLPIVGTLYTELGRKMADKLWNAAHTRFSETIPGVKIWWSYGIRKRFHQNVKPISVVSRGTNRKIMESATYEDANQFRNHFLNKRNLNPDLANICQIVNVGKQSQGKSFHSTVQSLLLTKLPIIFQSSHERAHYTSGVDISPPLDFDQSVIDRLNKYDDQVQYNKFEKLVIIDTEGDDSFLSSADEIYLMQLILNNNNCVIVHSIENHIKEEDVK